MTDRAGAKRTCIRFLYWIVIFLSLFSGSCVNPFNPDLRDNGSNLPANATPTELLQTLEQSYAQKNINLFKSCLSPDFRFELLSSEVSQIGIDLNNDGFKDAWWGYDQEVEYHYNLFEQGSTDGIYQPPDQINLRLQIPPSDQWQPDAQPGHENWIIIPCLFDLQLLFTANNSSITSNGVARFYLKQTGERWFIAIWRDESNI